MNISLEDISFWNSCLIVLGHCEKIGRPEIRKADYIQRQGKYSAKWDYSLLDLKYNSETIFIDLWTTGHSTNCGPFIFSELRKSWIRRWVQIAFFFFSFFFPRVIPSNCALCHSNVIWHGWLPALLRSYSRSQGYDRRSEITAF